MGKLILSDGKFYRDGVEVPVEIGNREQIDLLRRLEKTAEQDEELGGEQISIETNVSLEAKHECICGKKVYFETNYNDTEDGAWSDLNGQVVVCLCGRKWEICYSDVWRVSEKKK